MRTPQEAPPVMVCTRFGIRVRDHAWLAHRLELISAITAPSLLSQEDQRFSWVVLVDRDLPTDIRKGLEAALEPFGGRAFLQPRHRRVSWAHIARANDLSDGMSHLLTGRLDDDDAWSTSMVRVVRERVGFWLNLPDRGRGLCVTFPNGLEWVMYELLDVERLLNSGERVVHPPVVRLWDAPVISMNMFICALLEDRVTIMGPESSVLKRTDVRADTDAVATATPMWLCCRHKQTGSSATKANGAEVPWDVSNLAAHFGLDETAVQSYLDSADEHDYAIVRRPTDRKTALLRELQEVTNRVEACADPAPGLERLRRRQEELNEEIGQLEVNLLGDPATVLSQADTKPT